MNAGSSNDAAGWIRRLESELRRRSSSNAQWEEWLGIASPYAPSGNAPIYVSATQFTLSGDWTSASPGFYPVVAVISRRVKAFTTAYPSPVGLLGTITAASFAGGQTTITVAWDGGGGLDSGLKEVQFGIPAPGMAGLKITQPEVFGGIASGTNTYAVTLLSVDGVAPTTQAGLLQTSLLVQFTNGNTGAATLNANGFGAQALQKNGVALVSGDIPAGVVLAVAWDGTNYQLLGINATNFQGQPISNAAPTANQGWFYNGTLWLPAVSPSTPSPSISTTLANTTVGANAGPIALLSVASTPPASPTSSQLYRARVEFAVYFESHAASTNSRLACTLSDTGTMFSTTVTPGVQNGSTGSGLPVACAGAFTSTGTRTNAQGAVTFTVNGWAGGNAVDIDAASDLNTNAKSMIRVSWIPAQ